MLSFRHFLSARIPCLLVGLAVFVPAALSATSAVVGTGTPASCTEAAFDAGVTARQQRRRDAVVRLRPGNRT